MNRTEHQRWKQRQVETRHATHVLGWAAEVRNLSNLQVAIYVATRRSRMRADDRAHRSLPGCSGR